MTAGNARGVAASVALGSNLGDRKSHLEQAVAALARTPRVKVVRVSRWFETEPIGGPRQGKFLNGVLDLETTLSARELFDVLQQLERDHGRQRSVRHGPRTLDLDLLTFGEAVIDEPDLIVPHPRMEERTFVLEPLADIAPERKLPRSGLKVRERLAELRRDEG